MDDNRLISIETRVKVFAQYLFSKFRHEGTYGTLRTLTGISNSWNLMSDEPHCDGFRSDRCVLVLKPAFIIDSSAHLEVCISDEDALELAKCFYNSSAIGGNLIGVGKYIVQTLIKDNHHSPTGLNSVFIYQFLQAKGYDLPNHLLDGKTLEKCGLAIYEQKKADVEE